MSAPGAMESGSGCELCGAAERAPAFPRASGPARDHSLARCTSCGLVFLARPRDDDEVAAAHAGFYAVRSRRFVGGFEEAVRILRDGRARLAAGLVPPGGSVLDVGCGRGVFLQRMGERGFTVRGTELSADAAQNALPGVPVDVGELVPGRYPACSFDLVSIWHVLEHLRRPRLALEAACEVLRPGGALLIAVPNLDSLQARLGGERWFHLDLPRHVFHFTPRTLGRMVEAAGLRIERLSTGQWEMDPFGLLQTALNRIGVPHNALYDTLRAGRGGRADLGPALRTAMWVAFALGMPPACLASLVFRLLGRAGTIVLVARKAVEAPPA